jgi:hypothetical protein
MFPLIESWQEEKMAGRLSMEQKELLRGKLMELVKEGKLPLKPAALELKVSYQQGKWIYAAYLSGGRAGAGPR